MLKPPFGVGADAGAFDVILSWRTPDGDSITGYQVLRGASADEMTVIADDTASTDTAYVDAPVTPETIYYYAVRARSAQGLGPASPAHLVTTAAAASLVFLDSDDNLETQQQQGSHTWCPNLSNPATGSTVFVYKAGSSVFNPEQSFRTGRHPAGYSVTEIQTLVADISLGGGNAGPSVHIYANSGSGSGAPGQRLHSFTEHTGFAPNSTVRFTSTSTVTLDPNTRYWLVFESTDVSASYELKRVERLTARTDPCGELDWSIDPHSTVGAYNLSPPGRLFDSGKEDGLLVAILGSQVDDGSQSELECTDTDAATTTYTKIGMGATVVGAQQGDLHSNDEDWFQVTLEAGVKYQFDTFTSIFGLGYSASDGTSAGSTIPPGPLRPVLSSRPKTLDLKGERSAGGPISLRRQRAPTTWRSSLARTAALPGPSRAPRTCRPTACACARPTTTPTQPAPPVWSRLAAP